ncbi:hypothetical protein J8I87_40390 [Paraburkholderia sp. LEh10]|uniref:cation-transporting P-type ATPase n=1 Tax=Paraburkholderia sp. LEh10 TaxID=2821353 RepID=UPI001AE201C9|nr:cation-transporting P-type ATPase [Paraburkholderia sp. LEh10]MBP0595786.1 hypothetical protein [Paraburkholderia sp. LEh10]
MNFDFAGLMNASGGSAQLSRAKPEFDRDSAQAALRIREISGLETEHVYERLKTGPGGLSEAEAAQRLVTHGRNTVAQHAGDGVVHHLGKQVRSPLNLMLLSLALVSAFLGDVRAAIVITVMVVLSVGLSFVQEYRSNQAAARLRAMVRTTATVLRRPRLASAPIETTGANHGNHLHTCSRTGWRSGFSKAPGACRM